VFVFEQRSIDEAGKIKGQFRATGTRPRFAQKLARNGISLPPELFRYVKEV
jgi:pilus assembly protein CpaF